MLKVIDEVREHDDRFPDVVLTVGSFDGIHLGHRRILEEVVDLARDKGGTAAVLTMRPHPRQFFVPAHAPNLLTSESKKLQLLEAAGIEVVYILKFDKETAAIEPVHFVEEIVRDHCHATALIVGHDCRFGKGAQGDIALLEKLGPSCGFTVKEVPPLFIESERVSSTLVRERVLQGDLEGVHALLGRPYSIVGEVVAGRGIGSKLNFPTANVKPHHSATPAQGVYIAEVFLEGRSHPAAVNIGIAPTIRHEDVTIEAHILDFSEEILDSEIEIVFHKRVRPEKKFPSLEALTTQIGKDVEAVRTFFAERQSAKFA